MTANLLTAPMVEPVSLSEMKAHLKLDHTNEDELLLAFLSAARVHLENLTGRHFITQTWRVVLDGPFDEELALPVQPVAKLLAAAVLTNEGDLLDLCVEGFSILQKSDPAKLINSAGRGLSQGQHLQLDLETGFGPAPQDVPAPLRQAIKMVVTEWTERRFIVDPSKLPSLNTALAPLIGPYRTMRL